MKLSRWVLVFIASMTACAGQETENHNQTIRCPLGERHRAKANGYHPSWEFDGFLDMKGNPLKTLQDFLEGKSEYVTVSLDQNVPIPYATPICIPEMNRKYKKQLVFQFRDTGRALTGAGFTKCHICVRDEEATHDFLVNQYLTLVVPKIV